MSAQPRETRHSDPTGRLRLTATDVMTVSEVSDLLHVPVSTIADWGRRGLLPSVKIGRRRLYIRPKIEAQLLDGRGAPASAIAPLFVTHECYPRGSATAVGEATG